MKKLIVLVMLLMAAVLWAQDLTITGKIEYMYAQDLAAGKEFSDKPMYELKFNFDVDEFNTAYLEFEEGPMSPGFASQASADSGYAITANGAPLPDKAWFQTDIGAAFDLPVGLTFKFGLEEWNNKDGIKVTKSEWEDFLGEADFRTWGAQVEIMPADVATIRAQWAWNQDPKNILIGAYGTIDPVTYEVTYTNNKQDLDQGWIEAGAEFATDVTSDINVAVALMGEYDMSDAADALGIRYGLQAGAQALYKGMASLGLAWRGIEDYIAGGLQVQVWAMPIADTPLELYGLVGLGLDSDVYPESFDSLEISVKYSFGKAEYWIGYFYAPAGSGGIAKEALDEGVAGLGTSDTGAIWVRGKISL
jgi:hypothetical protein